MEVSSSTEIDCKVLSIAFNGEILSSFLKGASVELYREKQLPLGKEVWRTGSQETAKPSNIEKNQGTNILQNVRHIQPGDSEEAPKCLAVHLTLNLFD